MAAEIKVPTLGESVSSATVARWLKQPGDAVAADEPVVELETDKVTVEVNAPSAGRLGSRAVEEGAEVGVGALLGIVETEGAAAAPKPQESKVSGVTTPPPAAGPVPRPAPAPVAAAASPVVALPAAAKLMQEQGVAAAQVGAGTGKDGRITKGDVIAFLSSPAPKPATAAPRAPRTDDVREERVKMTRLRRTIAQRLKEAQNTAAMLTTFNEVDMSAVMALRAEYKDAFEKKHSGARLGFMSFFVKACVAALREIPAVNAEIDGDDMIFRKFVNMGIAVGGPSGLVVPVMRDADQLNFAQIEKTISDFGRRARDGQLKIDELSGGTFSITNGGIYGSLLSTPILNPPQSAILGMHKIQERPVAIAGKVEIRPMMYLALSYDHRVIDGKEAVTFLVRVKEGIEDPRRLLLDL
ncbi:MAG TPA: 2-oxoglutarate dehydrogenase complex dihydrolipoyllysine-residue succinyltransferase [Acetobacteraceae bacterium]|nr:2-oxoglutarate dehydrogenase complex dihydrolipoyllysine-residue succinyltransferase [Acetobacteraceae bacterium]